MKYKLILLFIIIIINYSFSNNIKKIEFNIGGSIDVNPGNLIKGVTATSVLNC